MTAYNDAIGPMGTAFLATQRAQETSGLSAAELAALDLDEYARLVHGQTPAQAALSAYYGQPEPGAGGRSGAPSGDPSSSSPLPSAAPYEAPQGMTEEEMFHRWRAQRVRGGEGIGLLNQPTQTFTEAAQAKAGRNAMITSNVQEPRKVGRVFLADDIPASGRKNFYR